MARLARVVIPGCWHHVTQRGNHQMTVFDGDTDRRLYLELLKEHCAHYGVRVAGYCLMGNHVHLVAAPARAEALGRALGRTHNDYARWHNLKRRETGHLWQNRFYSCPLDGAHTWQALRYVEQNPVRAGLVARAEHWRWSSAAAHLGGRDEFSLLDWIAWREQWSPQSWREVLEQGVSDAALLLRIREATRTGRPLGGEPFVQAAESALGRALRPGKRGRKAKPTVEPRQQKLGIE